MLAFLQQDNNIEHVAVKWSILEILKAKNYINALRAAQASSMENLIIGLLYTQAV